MQIVFTNVKRSCIALALLAGLSVLSANKANAQTPPPGITVTVDSIDVTHGTVDQVVAKITFPFPGGFPNYRGAWSIWEDKSGDLLASGDNAASSPPQCVATAACGHTGGTKMYYVTAGIYYQIGGTVYPVTNANKSQQHSMP